MSNANHGIDMIQLKRKVSVDSYAIPNISRFPFFLRPGYLFLSIWIIILFLYSFGISYSFYPYWTTLLFLCIFCLSVFFSGYLTIYILSKIKCRGDATVNVLHVKEGSVGKVDLLLFVLSAIVVIYNYYKFGLPPIVDVLGFESSNYHEYGKFRGVLTPILSSIFLISSFENKVYKNIFFKSYSLLVLICYINRGPLLMMVFQWFALMVILKPQCLKMSFRYCVAFLVFVTFAMQVLGEIRSGTDVFLNYLQIKDSYHEWNIGILWIMSYVTQPVSNFLWISTSYNFDGWSCYSFYRILPAFMQPNVNGLEYLQGNSNIIDNVHFYLMYIFADYWWAGVILYNYVLGILAGIIEYSLIVFNNPLVYVIFLSAIALIFFVDYVLYFPTIFQFGICYLSGLFIFKKNDTYFLPCPI